MWLIAIADRGNLKSFPRREDQAAMRALLVQWVREYETRDDEYGLKRHREVFDRVPGRKREYKSVESYSDG